MEYSFCQRFVKVFYSLYKKKLKILQIDSTDINLILLALRMHKENDSFYNKSDLTFQLEVIFCDWDRMHNAT